MQLNYEDPAGQRLPQVLAGGNGCGKILLYRKTGDMAAGSENGSAENEGSKNAAFENGSSENSRELIDTLYIENALSIYSNGDGD